MNGNAGYGEIKLSTRKLNLRETLSENCQI